MGWVGWGEPKAPECGFWLCVSSIPCWRFLGLFWIKNVLGISRGHQMHFDLSCSLFWLRLPTHQCASCCSASLCHHSQSLAWNRLEATVSCLKFFELQLICCRSGMSTYLSNNEISDVGMQKKYHDLTWMMPPKYSRRLSRRHDASTPYFLTPRFRPFHRSSFTQFLFPPWLTN